MPITQAGDGLAPGGGDNLQENVPEFTVDSKKSAVRNSLLNDCYFP